MKKKVYFINILGLNLKNSDQIGSLFDMNIDMGERIAGKGPPNSQKYTVFLHFGP